jgi:hypothetical protein
MLMNIPDRRTFLLELLNRTKEHIGRYCPITDGMVYDGMCCALHFALSDMVITASNIPAGSSVFLVEHCKSVFPKVYLKISEVVVAVNKISHVSKIGIAMFEKKPDMTASVRRSRPAPDRRSEGRRR